MGPGLSTGYLHAGANQQCYQTLWQSAVREHENYLGYSCRRCRFVQAGRQVARVHPRRPQPNGSTTKHLPQVTIVLQPDPE